jgi:nucleoside-diphosphate-sugar epimerase
MEDAIKATISIMQAPSESIHVRSSYNLGGISFTPAELVEGIKHHFPSLQVNYQPDFRQQIADSWPNSINDDAAKKDWNWKHTYKLNDIIDAMLNGIAEEMKLN